MKTREINKILFSADIMPFSIEALSSKYPLKITAEAKGKIAEIRITGAIYDWNNTADEITKKIDGFLAEGIKDVEVYLNGPGGDVFQASEIENQIQRFTGSKTGTGGALIASAYTKIASSLDSFHQAENGQYMYHKPSAYLSGNEDKVESTLRLLKNLTAQYKDGYSKLTGLTGDEIESNWSKGDVWLTAKEAKAQKFITGVIGKASITTETKAIFEACGSPIKAKITETEKPKAKEVAETPEATAEQITAITNQLLIDKKITGIQVPFVSNLLAKDLKNTLALYELKESLVKVSSLIQTGNKTGRESWSLDDWRKNDPIALRKDPDFYVQLVEAEYGK